MLRVFCIASVGESCVMLRVSRAPSIAPTQIDGSFAAWPEVIFQPRDFAALCALIWAKPDTAIAVIANVSDRAARDYLSGLVPMPGVVIAAINVAITKHARRKRYARAR